MESFTLWDALPLRVPHGTLYQYASGERYWHEEPRWAAELPAPGRPKVHVHAAPEPGWRGARPSLHVLFTVEAVTRENAEKTASDRWVQYEAIP